MEKPRLPAPEIQVNDQLLGTLESRRREPDDKNPNDLTIGIDYEDLRELLRACQISHSDGIRKFWPDQLLCRILTRERVSEELRSSEVVQDTETLLWYLQKLFPGESLDRDTENGAQNGIEASDPATNRTKERYIKIYAILVLCERQPFLKEFIDAEIHDDDLPFVKCKQKRPNGPFKLAPRRRQGTDISCFRDWKPGEIEQFYDFQFQVLIPYFCQSTDPKALVKYVSYIERTIMPWIQEDMNKLGSGGYGVVHCMRIHSASHGFQNLAQVKLGNGMFALKKMVSKDIKDFENETRMLGIFSGYHDHLIMLLQAFSWNDDHYLLFPWANCDLEGYWAKTKAPYDAMTGMNPRSMGWISRQILGLTSGLHNIHNPMRLDSGSDMMFGR